MNITRTLCILQLYYSSTLWSYISALIKNIVLYMLNIAQKWQNHRKVHVICRYIAFKSTIVHTNIVLCNAGYLPLTFVAILQNRSIKMCFCRGQ